MACNSSYDECFNYFSLLWLDITDTKVIPDKKCTFFDRYVYRTSLKTAEGQFDEMSNLIFLLDGRFIPYSTKCCLESGLKKDLNHEHAFYSIIHSEPVSKFDVIIIKCEPI